MTVATWRQPSFAIAVSDVPSPSAPIAMRSPQLEASTRTAFTGPYTGDTAGIWPARLFRTHSARKTSAKTGTGTFAAPCSTPLRVNHQPTASTTGSSRKTRKSFTTTAVFPPRSETA